MGELLAQGAGLSFSGNGALAFALGNMVVAIVIGLGVRRYGITQTGRKDERAALSEDTQAFIDTLSDRYREMDKTFHTRMLELQNQLQNMTLRYSASVAENGELLSKLTIEAAKHEALKADLIRQRLDFEEFTAAHAGCDVPRPGRGNGRR